MQRYGARMVAVLIVGLYAGAFLQSQGSYVCTNGPEYVGWFNLIVKVMFPLALLAWVTYCAGREAGKERNY